MLGGFAKRRLKEQRADRRTAHMKTKKESASVHSMKDIVTLGSIGLLLTVIGCRGFHCSL